MPSAHNPLRLNPLQLKTLALLQLLAGDGGPAQASADGLSPLPGLPQPHGDHFHIEGQTVPASMATGLHNRAVWLALARKGLVAEGYPDHLALTADGVAYDTGLLDTGSQNWGAQSSDH
jgi:hypothetical protein